LALSRENWRFWLGNRRSAGRIGALVLRIGAFGREIGSQLEELALLPRDLTLLTGKLAPSCIPSFLGGQRSRMAWGVKVSWKAQMTMAADSWQKPTCADWNRMNLVIPSLYWGIEFKPRVIRPTQPDIALNNGLYWKTVLIKDQINVKLRVCVP
jgi:hypothetical protein